MIKIRLSRLGARNAAFYRIVALDEQKKRGGKALDIIGTWDPKKDIKKIDHEKIKKWVENGAIVSSAVKKLL